MSLLTGGVYPAQALLFAYLVSDLLNPDTRAMRSRANQLSLWWVIIAITLFLAYLVQGSAFGYSSEKMVFPLVKSFPLILDAKSSMSVAPIHYAARNILFRQSSTQYWRLDDNAVD